MAVVFVTKIENEKSSNEGLCLKCAKELGIPQVRDILEKMGIGDDELDSIDNEIAAMMPIDGENGDGDGEGDNDSRTPAVDFGKLFGGFPFPGGFVRLRRRTTFRRQE